MRKTVRNLSIVGILVCSIFLMGMKFLPVEAVESINGTWKNQDYDVHDNKYAKIKFEGGHEWDAGNIWYIYNTTNSKEPYEEGTYEIIEGWSSTEGTYYKVIRTSQDKSIQYELYRFTKLYREAHHGKVLEIESSKEDFPTEINSNSSSYSILYRSYFWQRLPTALVIIGLVVLAMT